MSNTHYFFSENADRPIRVGKRSFAFDIINRIGGTSQGVIAIGADDYTAFTAVAVKMGVIEISAADYGDAKKKPSRFSPRALASPATPILPPVVEKSGGLEPVVETASSSEDEAAAPIVKPVALPPLKGKGAVVVPGGSVERKEAADALPVDIEDAVLVERAAPPVETAAAAAKPRKPRAARADLTPEAQA